MICKKCGFELSDESTFCNKCGKKVTVDSKKSYLPMVGVIGIVFIGIVIVLILILANNPIKKFEQAIKDNKYIDATKVFDEKIKGDKDKENDAEQFLINELKSIVDGFKKNTIDYTNAKTRIEAISKTDLLKDNVTNAMDEINELNDSRTAYQKGLEFTNSRHLQEAINEFKKVISIDNNYQEAQSKITSLLSDYKTEVMQKADEAASKQEYSDAVDILNQGLAILEKDSELEAKKSSYEKLNEEKIALERKAKMEELKNNQEVEVIKISTFTDWLEDISLCVVVRNNTDKVVKKYTVGWLGYDKDGYPVKTGWLSPDFLKYGEAEANIQPHKTFGEGMGWQLTGGYENTTGSKFIACISDVEYYDGTKWHNEYFDYWLEEYKEKPLK